MLCSEWASLAAPALLSALEEEESSVQLNCFILWESLMMRTSERTCYSALEDDVPEVREAAAYALLTWRLKKVLIL